MPQGQITRISTGFLDTVNDATAGAPVASPTGAVPWPGMVGMETSFSNADAAKRGKNNTLYGGVYKYVQYAAVATQASARGLLCFYSTLANMQANIVINDSTAATIGRVAGVSMNAVTKGNYGWIQVDGIANLQFVASVTDKTDGNVVVSSGSAGKVDAVADATGTLTYALVKKIVGIATELPADGSITTVHLRIGRNFS